MAASEEVSDEELHELNRTDKKPARTKRGFSPWKGVIWRLLSSLTLSVLIAVLLFVYDKKESLTQSDRRWFTVLAILVSSLVSLSVGSLLNLLGGMIRWPLLAAKRHRPNDVS